MNRPCCPALLLSATLAAQTTWIVDAQNGPGTHFTDLQSAVTASSIGDTVLVRWVDPLVMPYAGAVISHGLTIVGTGGQPGLSGALRVELLPAGQHVVVRDFVLAPFLPGPTSPNCHLLIRANAGSVHLYNVDRAGTSSPFSTLNQWLVDDCGLVTLTECQFATVGALGSLRIEDTDLITMHSCLLAPDGQSSTLPTLRLDDSELVLVDSSLTGPSGPFTSGPAVAMCGSKLRLAGLSTVASGSGVALMGGFGGNCTVLDMVDVGPVASLGFSTGALIASADIPALGTVVDPNRLMTTRIHGEPNGIALFVGGQPTPTPGPFLGGIAWLDPNTAFFVLALPLDGSGTAVWQATFAANLPIGISLWLQGATAGNNGLFLTTPTVLTLP